MNNSSAYAWYADLAKPLWAPEAWVFGPVWAILYFLIAISFGYVFFKVLRGAFSWTLVVPFVLNLVCNLLFSPIQFGLQNLLVATVDIILVLVTLVWAMWAVWRHARWVALVNIPYLVWVLFATALQTTILFMNW